MVSCAGQIFSARALIAAALVTQQRGFDTRPMEKNSSPAKPDTGDFAGYSPTEQSAAAYGQSL
jgi:hypothetical protein